jgi:hypothetical protein
MVLVDTNVLLDVFQNDPVWSDWSVDQLRAQAQVHALVVNPMIYSEVSLAFRSVAQTTQALAALRIDVIEFSKESLFLAARAFLAYRQAGRSKGKVLPDFFVGAQASVLGCGLLTRDVSWYRSYFPRVRLIHPT